MPKTQEELKELKEEYESLKKKLNELTEDELVGITGGVEIWDIAVKLKEGFKYFDPKQRDNN